jgi:hypothetical protein
VCLACLVFILSSSCVFIRKVRSRRLIVKRAVALWHSFCCSIFTPTSLKPPLVSPHKPLCPSSHKWRAQVNGLLSKALCPSSHKLHRIPFTQTHKRLCVSFSHLSVCFLLPSLDPPPPRTCGGAGLGDDEMEVEEYMCHHRQRYRTPHIPPPSSLLTPHPLASLPLPTPWRRCGRWCCVEGGRGKEG